MTTATRLLLAGLVLTHALPVQAQTRPSDLALVTVEDLMNLEITSASRKEQRADEVPAAVYVITQDDIRRSGMTTVPDLLRLVPGVDVAQINGNKWAVSARGFNSLYSSKLLVLVDGRSIYNPLFAAVLWDSEDLMLEDIERIEVIRGPGAAVWGANAVNGVINILTKSSADTQGLFARVGEQAPGATDLAVRYGGKAGSGTYRVFTQAATHADTQITGSLRADDDWRTLTSGFRGDWTSGADAFLLQGSATAGQQRPLWLNLDPATAAISRTSIDAVSDTQVGNLLGRWQHTRANGASLQLQSFVDLAHRQEAIGDYHRRTIDLDAAYHTKAGTRHDLVAGGGYRSIVETMIGSDGYQFMPDHAHTNLVNAFVQDEVSLGGNVTATLGVKFEHDTLAGAGLQPTARVMWHLARQQHLWAAVSRALRTPSLIDRGIRVEFPPMPQPNGPPVVIGAMGNPNIGNEQLIGTEAGYRINLSSIASIDATAFLGRYDGLVTYEPVPVSALLKSSGDVHIDTEFQNVMKARTSGAEVSGRVTLTSGWQVDGSVSSFHLTPDPNGSLAGYTATYDGSAPQYQWRGHSAWSLGRRAQADLLIFHVGTLGALRVPAYTRVDARGEWQWSPHLSMTAGVQNLFDAVHAEFTGDEANIVSTLVPRTATLRFTWRF